MGGHGGGWGARQGAGSGRMPASLWLAVSHRGAQYGHYILRRIGPSFQGGGRRAMKLSAQRLRALGIASGSLANLNGLGTAARCWRGICIGATASWIGQYGQVVRRCCRRSGFRVEGEHGASATGVSQNPGGCIID